VFLGRKKTLSAVLENENLPETNFSSLGSNPALEFHPIFNAGVLKA
jgi:hypothetical protein